MSVHLFYNRRTPGASSSNSAGVYYDEERVEQLRARGITPNRPQPSSSPQRRLPVVQVTMTPNGPQVAGDVQSTSGRSRDSARTAAAAASPRTSLELVEENARLRSEIDQLRRDNQALSDEVARLSGTRPKGAAAELDDSARRFALLELE